MRFAQCVAVCLLSFVLSAPAQAGPCPGGVCEMPAFAVRQVAGKARGVGSRVVKGAKRVLSVPVKLVRKVL